MTRRPVPIASDKSAPDQVDGRCPAAIPAWAIAAPAQTAEPAALATPIGDTQVVTITEAAAMFRVCTRTVSRMIDRGELSAFRVGRSVRLQARDLMTIINAEHFPFCDPL